MACSQQRNLDAGRRNLTQTSYSAVVFDMDGLLIDSEPLWQQAEIEVFATVGLNLTRADCALTMGVRIDEVVAFWHRRRPWSPGGPSQALVTEQIVDRVIALIRTQAELLPGAVQALGFFSARGLPLGLASSSPLRLIDAVLDRFALRRHFQVIHSAQHEPLGKPHPAVYLSTARLLGQPAPGCLAIEDSLNGLISAKAARMGCIAVPAAESRADPRFSLADVVLESLEGIDAALWQRLSAS